MEKFGREGRAEEYYVKHFFLNEKCEIVNVEY